MNALQCPLREEDFNSDEAFKNHMFLVHIYKCHFGNDLYKRTDDNIKHVKDNHSFICKDCDKHFVHNKDLE